MAHQDAAGRPVLSAAFALSVRHNDVLYRRLGTRWAGRLESHRVRSPELRTVDLPPLLATGKVAGAASRRPGVRQGHPSRLLVTNPLRSLRRHEAL